MYVPYWILIPLVLAVIGLAINAERFSKMRQWLHSSQSPIKQGQHNFEVAEQLKRKLSEIDQRANHAYGVHQEGSARAKVYAQEIFEMYERGETSSAAFRERLASLNGFLTVMVHNETFEELEEIMRLAESGEHAELVFIDPPMA